MTDLYVDGNLGVGTTAPPDPRVRGYFYNGSEMVMLMLKTGGDSNDLNIDGAVVVKHDRNYDDTPGYAHTLQVYAEAGQQGLILGCNAFDGVSEPYVPGYDEQPTGFVRFELGPRWPASEVARFNNRGDLIIGWSTVRGFAGSQMGDLVTTTSADFQPADVGKFVCWGDAQSGMQAHADRIVEVLDYATVQVETPRQVASQAARVCSPRVVVRCDGGIEMRSGPPPAVTREDAGVLFVQDGALMFRGSRGTISRVAPA